jgi:hypothetical protein
MTSDLFAPRHPWPQSTSHLIETELITLEPCEDQPPTNSSSPERRCSSGMDAAPPSIQGKPPLDSESIHSSQAAGIVLSQSLSTTRKFGTLLHTAVRQSRVTLVMCLGAIPLSILLFLYVYAALVSDNPHLGPFLFSPSRTLLIITILSQGLALLIRMLFNSVLESLRWYLVSRSGGVDATTFLGLSGATSSWGVLNLLYAVGIRGHTVWCSQRYL